MPAIGKNYVKYTGELFSTKTQYFRVAITTDMNGVQAHLRAVLDIPPGGKGGAVSVVQFSLR